MTTIEQRDAILSLLRNEFAVNVTVHPDNPCGIRIDGADDLEQLLRVVANNLAMAYEIRPRGEDNEGDEPRPAADEDARWSGDKVFAKDFGPVLADIARTKAPTPWRPEAYVPAVESVPQPVEDGPTAPIPHETLAEVSDRWLAGQADPPIAVSEKPTVNLRGPGRPVRRTIPGCTCSSGLTGGSCTLDCQAPAWTR